jgi:hypothetical protein
MNNFHALRIGAVVIPVKNPARGEALSCARPLPEELQRFFEKIVA